MTEITILFERREESGWLTASWDAADAGGGIVTRGKDLPELQTVNLVVQAIFRP